MLQTSRLSYPWRENLFETLPEDRKTAEVCRFAIKKSAFNIEFVPEAIKTPELWYVKTMQLGPVMLLLRSMRCVSVPDWEIFRHRQQRMLMPSKMLYLRKEDMKCCMKGCVK